MGHPRLDDQELSRSKARARARPGLGCCHEWPLFPAGPGVGGGSVGKAAAFPLPYPGPPSHLPQEKESQSLSVNV